MGRHDDQHAMRVEIAPVEGLPEIASGDPLGGLIAERCEIAEGDVLVIPDVERLAGTVER